MNKLFRMCNLLLLTASFSVVSLSSYADPNGGHGHGQGKEHQKNKPNKGHNGNGKEKADHLSLNKSNSISVSLTYNEARALALDSGITGYHALPPGIAKNLARGKPLPPGIAKKVVPPSMLVQLPHYPGYEWSIVGNDLVLIALSTAVVTSIINNVFDWS
ncbi:anti-virulence regulator CigR family protein [Providencia stuartii]|nr:MULTISPECIES: anti-virulence regulator CigR family protein [Providencia]MDN0020039.1 anti-virulence regulator CigR family protein [Providencia stuartii]